jgi:hypothetical protein
VAGESRVVDAIQQTAMDDRAADICERFRELGIIVQPTGLLRMVRRPPYS